MRRTLWAAAIVVAASSSVGAQQASTMGLAKDAKIAAAFADVTPARLRTMDSVLVSFGTRHTMSDTLSATRGIGAARRWIHAQLSSYSKDCGGCLRVEYDTGSAVVGRSPERPVVRMVNVVAWLPGRDTNRVVVIGGHYDSCICSTNSMDFTADAPGADDDGSGTVAVMELARVMGKHFPRGFDASVALILYTGEEQGLLGSTQFAERLKREGKTVTAAFTDDIIGNTIADDGRVDSVSVRVFAVDSLAVGGGELARYVWATGALYQPQFEVIPVLRLDRLGRGGDHRPFVERGIPGLRFSERLENYKRQHLPTDTLNAVNFNYIAKVARLNLATVASLAAAPARPEQTAYARDRDSGGQSFTIRWSLVANAASYELLVRRTTAPTYTRIVPVGNVTQFLLDEQLDDVWVGVRAVGADGHRSLTTVVGAPGGARLPAQRR
ncbi:MAG: M20/M25/M40 family metallo-hydrolase [Gemmatimonadaceae bacterium]|nr:M20/M25/M40 family metallo-hydrolase [Gemmatimonadaceae bacterium]